MPGSSDLSLVESSSWQRSVSFWLLCWLSLRWNKCALNARGRIWWASQSFLKKPHTWAVTLVFVLRCRKCTRVSAGIPRTEGWSVHRCCVLKTHLLENTCCWQARLVSFSLYAYMRSNLIKMSSLWFRCFSSVSQYHWGSCCGPSLWIRGLAQMNIKKNNDFSGAETSFLMIQ